MEDEWITVTKKKKVKKGIPLNEFQKYDDLTKLVYNIINTSYNGITAQNITLKINNDLNTEYTKQDIGNILYDSPLTIYLVRKGLSRPRVWFINKKKLKPLATK